MIAVKAELVVRRQPVSTRRPRSAGALEQVAERRGTLAEIQEPPDRAGASGRLTRRPKVSPRKPGSRPTRITSPTRNGPLSQLEIWRLNDERRATRSTSHGGCARSRRRTHPDARAAMNVLPAVSPNHVAILSPAAGGCPAAPPKPAAEPDRPFVEPPTDESTAKVTILDSGYIWIKPPITPAPRRARDGRARSVVGHEHGSFELAARRARRSLHRSGRPARRDLRARHVHRRVDREHRSAHAARGRRAPKPGGRDRRPGSGRSSWACSRPKSRSPTRCCGADVPM